jgi:outer membrane translocation and assembly module TamA
VWDVGGIGTLRGEPFKSQSGDQFYLLNAEYSYLFHKNLHALAFLDWGTAFYGKDAWAESRPALDGGIGIRIAEGPAMITLARNLQRSDAPYLVGVRLGGTWE